MLVQISGLPPNTPHGFHIHEYGDTVTDGELNQYLFSLTKSLKYQYNLEQTGSENNNVANYFPGCQSTGGHYNPFNKTHGAPADQIR